MIHNISNDIVDEDSKEKTMIVYFTLQDNFVHTIIHAASYFQAF
jgi:hypothetical protein